MSRPRYDWWTYVKGMIRRYPELRAEQESLQQQNVTQQLSGMPGGGGTGRAVEQCALRELTGIKRKEYEAVRKAVNDTMAMGDFGAIRLRIIYLVFWKRSLNLEGAAQDVNCSYRTARRHHREFIMTVAKNFGLLDE